MTFDKEQRRRRDLKEMPAVVDSEIAERRRLERPVIETADGDRHQLAKVLHDTVCQSLSGISILARVILRSLESAGRKEAREARELVDAIGAAIREVQNLVQGLHPAENNVPILIPSGELNGSATNAPASAKKRVFIVDDHPIFRQGLAKMIGTAPDIEICGDATSAAQALDAVRQIEADVAVVDISLPGANGLELIKNLRAEHPSLPILVVSAHDEQVYALRALRAGASGYLMKREGDGLLIPALRRVLAGNIWVSPSFGQQLIYKVARGSEQGGSPLDALTDRELEILRLVGEGKTSHQIAEALHLSIKTVESHRLHVKVKLGLQTAVEMARFATEWVSQQEN